MCIRDRNQRYWRGPVLWNFDGRRWTRIEELPSNVPAPFTPEGAAVEYTVIPVSYTHLDVYKRQALPL